MKVCIFIPGLGEAFEGTTVRNYAKRLADEMNFNNEVPLSFVVKEEKLEFDGQLTTQCISIYSSDGDAEKLEYRFYDFFYRDTLTREFRERNIMVRCYLLLLTAGAKLPIMIKRLFVRNLFGYASKRLRLLSLYTFAIFFVIALGGLLLIPGVITLLGEILKDNEKIGSYLAAHPGIHGFAKSTEKFLLAVVSITVLIFSFVPASKDIVTALATEFSCVHYYLELGQQKQAILGRLDSLIQYVAERETMSLKKGEELDMHIHSYSFGSIIALDLLFPFGNAPGRHTTNLINCLVTVGCPYEFLASYYPVYFQKRNAVMADKVKWYNVFSLADALSSNFRNDAENLPAVYSLDENTPLPHNLQYELANFNPAGLMNFLSLYSLKAHQFYWNANTGGNSCLRVIYSQLRSDKYLD